MGILLQYNNATSYTWEQLLSNTNLNAVALSGQLGSLVKGKVLLLDPPTSKIGEANVKYNLNMDYKSKKIRIQFNVPVKSEQKAESDDTHKIIEEDRKLLIQVFFIYLGCYCQNYEDS